MWLPRALPLDRRVTLETREETLTPHVAEVEHRRERAVRLALAGHPYDHIATELGYASRSGAWKAVSRALRGRTSDAVDEYRSMEIARLEALNTIYYPKAMKGDRHAAEMCLKVISAEVKLLGLDTPNTSDERVESIVISAEQPIRDLKKLLGAEDEPD